MEPVSYRTDISMTHSKEGLLARLHQLGIATRTHEHPPLFTVEQSQALRGEISGGHSKNLFLKDKKGQIWLVVAEEDAAIDLKRLHTVIGSARLSFGSADLLEQVLGVKPGSVTPFGLINDKEGKVNVVLDEGLMGHDVVNFHPLTNEATTSIAPDDLLRFIADCGHKPIVVALHHKSGTA